VDDEVIVEKEDVLPYVERVFEKFPEIRVIEMAEGIISVEGFPRLTVVYIEVCD